MRGKGWGINAEIYMEKLDLNAKADLYSHQIDTGSKRCLQVGLGNIGLVVKNNLYVCFENLLSTSAARITYY